MKGCFEFAAVGLFLLFASAASTASAGVRLPSIIGDNMVLQRNSSVRLWGEADGREVSVRTSWDGKNYRARTDDNGKWSVDVDIPDAGGPYSITLSDGDAITLDNVMSGEVWICSGQSNMEMPIRGFTNQPVVGAEDAVVEAVKYPDVRLFTVPHLSSETPVGNFDSEWKTASAASVSEFSAVAWFFGRTLADQLDIPIGLVHTSWGGSRIEAWMIPEAIDRVPGIDRETAKSGTADNAAPGRLYNGMIAPICDFAARGFIWYQGESNIHNHYDYSALQSAMIELWRQSWGDGRMPFYMTQLAPYGYDDADALGLPLTVEAQYRAAALVPYSGIAATTDLGNRESIHPGKKRPVGRRLAYLALANDYGVEGLPAPAPTYRSMVREGDRLIVSFNNLSGGGDPTLRDSFAAVSADGLSSLSGFEIAGADGVFHPAQAGFKWENRIEVYSENVPEPVAVRYAFRNFPPAATVVTSMGQPLVPFRTDDRETE